MVGLSRRSYLRLIGFRFRRESVDPPHFAEHRAEGQGESRAEHPGPRLADRRIFPWLHESAVDPQQEHGDETRYHAG